MRRALDYDRPARLPAKYYDPVTRSKWSGSGDCASATAGFGLTCCFSTDGYYHTVLPDEQMLAEELSRTRREWEAQHASPQEKSEPDD